MRRAPVRSLYSTQRPSPADGGAAVEEELLVRGL
jgi:hypothetical protein